MLPVRDADAIAGGVRAKRRAGVWTGYPAAIVVIVLAYLLGITASRVNSATFDEGVHLAGGYIHYVLGQPRIHTENGYLSQAIAAFPLLFTHPYLPNQTGWGFREASPFVIGEDFLFHAGNDPEQILLLGRAMIGVLMALTALVVYGWSRRLFSARAGMVSLVLFCLAPVVLAHGFLATSDMAVTCFFMLSLASFRWLLECVTVVRVVVCAAALAGCFLAKMSAPLILPVLALVLMLRLAVGARVGFGRRRVEITSWWKRALLGMGIFVVLAALVWGLIWATYGFTYSAFKDSPAWSGQAFYPSGQWTWALQKPGAVLHAIAFVRDHRLLPEAYLYGYAYVVQTSRLVVSYANGVVSHEGWWWFFPFVFLVSTPLPILLLMALAPVGVARRVWLEKGVRRWGERLLRVAPLLAWFVVYWVFAILSYRGSGPRHLLPVYPALCILLGVVPMMVAGRRWAGPLTVVICGWLAVESFLVRPHYLSYFNEAAGGPRNGYRRLVDSADDWGQDLPALARYLSRPELAKLPVYFSYFGSADPNHYGIKAEALPSFRSWRPAGESGSAVKELEAGVYCISVTMLENVYGLYEGAYTPATEAAYQAARANMSLREKALANDDLSAAERQAVRDLPRVYQALRFARLAAYLRKHEPAAQAGYSINIYYLGPADIKAALDGAPPYDEGEWR